MPRCDDARVSAAPVAVLPGGTAGGGRGSTHGLPITAHAHGVQSVADAVAAGVNFHVATVFSGLSALVVEDVADRGDTVVVTARARKIAVPCPACGTQTSKVHVPHRRTVRAVPGDGCQVVVCLWVRRLAGQISQMARELCGCPPRRPTDRARFPQHRPAPSVAPAGAEVVGSAGDRRGRFRSAWPPPPRHDHHGRRDRQTRRGPARPRG